MSTQCLPPSFRIRLTAREEMSSKHFQDGHHGGHLGYRNITIIAYLNCYVAQKPPTKFRLIRVRVYEQMCSEDFHDGRNFESECCSDVSNQVSAQRFKQLWIFLSPRCLPSSFFSIRHGLGGDVVLKKFKMAFTMSLKCLPSSFGSVRLTVWEEMSFEEFKDGYRSCNLRHQSGTTLAILNLYLIQMPPIKLLRPSRESEYKIFSNSKSSCCPNASLQLWTQSDRVREQMWFEDF